MKILYLSCHSVLEYDELSIFNDLGIDVFSPGAYVEPRNPGDPSMRPSIPMDIDPADRKAWDEFCVRVGGSEHAKERLDKEILDRFDVVMIMHMPDWVSKNWQVLKNKTVIWRTIGQSIRHQEIQLTPMRTEGMRVIRYSPMEENIPHYLGRDALIRFAKDPEEFKGWEWIDHSVITFNQATKVRADACNYRTYQKVTEHLPRKLYGPDNDDVGHGVMGKVPFEEMKEALRKGKCYFYLGTHPASYTLNFIEAWMTGIPMVCLGPTLGNPSRAHPGHNLYEIPELITHGEDGFWSDDPEKLTETINKLLTDEELAKRISAAGRKKAIEVFDRNKVIKEWDKFFKEYT